jgi:hypothetical protein
MEPLGEGRVPIETDLVRRSITAACALELHATFSSRKNHQGKSNVILFPLVSDRIGAYDGAIRTRERLGGLFKFYHRQAAEAA